MTEHIPGFERDQVILFPDTLDEYTTEENPVRFIDAFVDSLDLKILGFKRVEPNEMGRPPYDPHDLLKLYLWGYLNQVRSSRKLEKACVSNVEVMWLMKKLAPDFKTIADFRKENIDCIKPVFKEFVYLCKSLDLFGAELVGIDGSKFKAVNSRKRNFDEKTLAEALKRLEEKIARYLKEMEENDGADEGRNGSGSANSDVGKLKEKLSKLEEKKREYVQAQNLMKETGQKEVSLTDPDSRLMKNNARIEPCYNTETAIDSKNKLAVDYKVTNMASDRNQLSPMAKSAKEILQVEKIDATADRGFHDSVDIKECVDNGITPYVPEPVIMGRGEVKKAGVPKPAFYADKFVYDGATDSYICPAGQRLEFYYWDKTKGRRLAVYKTEACFTCPFFMTDCTRNKLGRWIGRWEHEEILEEMRARLKTEEGSRKAALRKELCEHPFGTMKRAFNQGYLLLKGLKKVNGEMGFTMLAYNMRRAINILGVKALLAYLLP
jgi:transposase